MKELTLEGVLNHTANLYNMISAEVQQDLKHANNKRCRRGNYGGVAVYLEYAYGIKCTGEEIRETLLNCPF